MIQSKLTLDQSFNLALQHHQAGRLREAEDIYRQILADQPVHVGAIHYLGVMAHQQGRNDAAIDLIRKAIALSPSLPEPHNNLGLALKANAQADEAIASYRQAIALKPNYVNAFFNLGVALQDKGQLDEAITAYRQAIAQTPDHAVLYYQLASVLKDQRRFDEAADVYRKAIALKPDYFDAYSNLGYVLSEIGQIEEAIAAYQQAIRLNPGAASAYTNLGNALTGRKRPDERIAAYRQAIILNPTDANAHSNLGNALRGQKRLDESIAAYRQAIVLDPTLPEAHNNLGCVLIEMGEVDEAIAAFDTAIALRPGYARAYCNLANAYREKGLRDRAVAAFRKAIALKPEFGAAHHALAYELLGQGDFEEGWQELEWRLVESRSQFPRRDLPQPRWDGRALNSQRILLQAELGFGDSIQFIRYCPLVAQRGGRIIIECHPELQWLFQTIEPECRVIARGQPLPDFDLHCPILSLPGIFGTTLEDIPNTVPYLHPDAKDARVYQQRLARLSPAMNVGLVWAGSAINPNDRNRSMTLADMRWLGKVPGVRFISLQKGSAASQAKAPPPAMSLIDWTDEFSNFSDAALIDNLDLVISVDTSTIHLAGALGKPVWTLLSYISDWRWLKNREDSPWYPSMRLFRQTALGDWDNVIKRVVDALMILIEDRK